MESTAGNLDRRAQSGQLRVGVVFVGLALLAAVALERLGAGVAARLGVVVPLFVGVYGIYAGLERTCGFCALARRRLTDDGAERVADPAELRALRRAGLRVIATSALLASAGAIAFAVAS